MKWKQLDPATTPTTFWTGSVTDAADRSRTRIVVAHQGDACAKVHVVTLHERLLKLTGSFRI